MKKDKPIAVTGFKQASINNAKLLVTVNFDKALCADALEAAGFNADSTFQRIASNLDASEYVYSLEENILSLVYNVKDDGNLKIGRLVEMPVRDIVNKTLRASINVANAANIKAAERTSSGPMLNS